MTSNRAFIEKINQAWAEGDTDYLIASVTDDVRVTMVGSHVTEGKAAFAKEFTDNSGASAPQITVTNVITHERSAVVEGTMVMADTAGEVKRYAFCDIYRLSAENDKIRELTSYLIETGKQTQG